MIKEGYDDFKRYRRDTEANSAMYEVLTPAGIKRIPSSKIKLGDFVILHANMRVPADMVLLRTDTKNGAVFIRTDQLDGDSHLVTHLHQLLLPHWDAGLGWQERRIGNCGVQWECARR